LAALIRLHQWPELSPLLLGLDKSDVGKLKESELSV